MGEWTRAKACSSNSCIEVRGLYRLLSHPPDPAEYDGPYTMIEIRNSDEPEEIYVQATPDEWAAFAAGVKAGDFDHITEEFSI
jgi:hypothetical protein